MIMATRVILYMGLVFTLIGDVFSINDAMADPKHGKRYQSQGIDNTTVAAIGTAVALISASDRDILSGYLRNNFKDSCPPGLAKKNNGCLPPGHAKKYNIGRTLDVGYSRLPGDLLGRLHPPRGYRYVQVDRDVLLIAEATKRVVDAVTLLSAVR